MELIKQPFADNSSKARRNGHISRPFQRHFRFDKWGKYRAASWKWPNLKRAPAPARAWLRANRALLPDDEK